MLVFRFLSCRAGALAPEAGDFGIEVRLLLYRNRRTTYRILYTIFDASEDASGVVRILRIRQGARPEAITNED